MAAIGVAIAGVFTAFKATTLGIFLTQNFFGRLLASVALSALQVALAPKPKTPGITTEVTQTGGTNPMSFILGRYATAGTYVCPPMSHGTSGKTPNAYLTYVVNLGDVPGQTLSRVIIDGNYVTLGSPAHADYGLPVTGIYTDHAWVKYYDGTQTSADPGLLAKYASYPERPWLADMIGRNSCYAIVTFRYNREKFAGFPKVLFEMDGIPLYDPRKDSTVGGSGTHRWATPSTWEQTSNPVVICYNAMRGISLPGLGVWGGSMPAEDLPFASWVSAMNSCDVAVSLSAGGSEPAWRAGYEVTVSTEPSAVIEELLKACAGQVAEAGGVWKIRVGGPALPVYFMTDDDVIITRPQDLDPFPAADQRSNGIAASYPEPAAIWEAKNAPPRYNATWEAEDGGRRSVASLQLPAVPYPNQVQRLMQFYAADDRRHRRHTMTLPPDAAVLEPLDTFSWTSARNGYTAKLFDVASLADDQALILQTVVSREVNAGDVAWSPSNEVAYSLPSPLIVEPASQTLDAWAAAPLSIADASGLARRPAVIMTWSATDMDAVDAVQYEVRVKATAVLVKVGTVSDVAGGQIIVADGILPGVIYQARGKPITPGRASAWTGWVDMTSPNIGISSVDLTASTATGINDTNMVMNALFLGGSLVDWRPFYNPANQAVVARAAPGVPANAPSDYVMQFSFPANSSDTSIFTGRLAYSDALAETAMMPVKAGASYAVSILAAASTITALTRFWVLVYFRKSDGSYTSYITLINQPSLPTTWTEYQASFVAPAGSIGCWLYVYGQASATLGAGQKVWWGNLSMRPKASQALIEVGAVSDTILGAAIAQVDVAITSVTTFLTIATGAIGPHQLWRCGVSYEAKITVGSCQVAFDIRYKYAGVWGPWVEKGYDTISSSAWDMNGITAQFSGQYDDVELRLVSRGASFSGTLSLKNIRLTATNLVR